MAGAKDAKKPKDEGSAAVLRRLSDELSELRADVDTIKRGKRSTSSPESASPPPAPALSTGSTMTDEARRKAAAAFQQELEKSLIGDNDAIVSIHYAYRMRDAETGVFTGSKGASISNLKRILEALDPLVSRLGLAFSSPQKVALIRALLEDGSQSAAQLGEQAGLSTGSLYHHLRELTHSVVIESVDRNKYQLTRIGRQSALLLFIVARQSQKSPISDNNGDTEYDEV